MSTTELFTISALLLMAVFDIYVIITKGKYESISAYVIRGSKKMPLVVLAFGILLGHLFWSMDSFDYLPKKEIIERCKGYIE